MVTLAAAAERRQRQVRMVRAVGLVMAVLSGGTYGFYTITDGTYPLVTCLYMTVITVSTVGFTEAIPVDTPALHWFTMSLILLGAGSLVFFFTSATAAVIEGDLFHGIWRRRLERRLSRQHRHIVVAGAGRTGFQAVEALLAAHAHVVVVDTNEVALNALLGGLGDQLTFIHGDAMDGETLLAAGIARANGLVASLSEDRDNIFLCVTALQLNPFLRIVAKANSPANEDKLTRVGATVTVSPARLGARRLANELLRPDLLSFTDAMLGSGDGLLLALVVVAPGSELCDRRLDEARLGDTLGVLVMGLRPSGQEQFQYHPASSELLAPGSTVVALGRKAELKRLRRALTRGRRE